MNGRKLFRVILNTALADMDEIETDPESEEPEESGKCEYCNGTGEVLAHWKISSRTIDMPYEPCPECRGTGLTEDY